MGALDESERKLKTIKKWVAAHPPSETGAVGMACIEAYLAAIAEVRAAVRAHPVRKTDSSSQESTV
jgi:hypothetical protein